MARKNILYNNILQKNNYYIKMNLTLQFTVNFIYYKHHKIKIK